MVPAEQLLPSPPSPWLSPHFVLQFFP